MTKGVVYYSDCRGDQRVLQASRDQLTRAIVVAGGIDRLVSVTLEPLDFFENFTIKSERGYLAMFRQQLAGLEEIGTDVVFFAEHDVLYSPSHFNFIPPDNRTFYYNLHTWRVDAKSGRALFYNCRQVSGLCGRRDLLVEHYRARVKHVEAHGFDRKIGFEPATNARHIGPPAKAESWMSAYPNVDIKTDFCLTPGRWSVDEFRNKHTCLGWTESDRVPTWGPTLNQMDQFLASLTLAKGAA